MLTQSQFFNETIRKYHIAFGDLFSGIIVSRSLNGTERQRITVPLEQSAKESWLERIRREPTLENRMQIVLPRLAFEFKGFSYDASRQLNPLHQRLRPVVLGSTTTSRRMYSGTPYILNFSLYLISDNLDDANQIVEQIVPFFSPEYALTVKVLPSLGIVDRCRILLKGNPTWEDNYGSAQFSTNREVLVTFEFDMHATFYGPTGNTSVIREVTVDMHSMDTTPELPIYITTEQQDFLKLEDSSGLLVSELSEANTANASRVARVHVVPDPVDMEPQPNPNVTVEVTVYEDGLTYNPLTDSDEA